ncbi:flagellar protein FlgN [Stutzerimonas stutzeri]|uniref:Flagellar protein FlgN n=1 Tax=Stutzerimonas stutzeri TaxID=316 RepID=A0A6I6LJA5_STUST|nr:flagellar protein FlgN [Stutzerimonas stutzeri]QGZ29333.1 flagellar protein FlgN [Stutzerimonas stutzeri]
MSQRDKLLEIVDDDLQQDCGDYLALRELMQELYARLLERDVPEIDRINQQVTVRVEAIAARAQRRSKVLTAFRLETTGVGMRRLLSSCSGARGESLQQHWQQVGDLAVQCQQLNEHNGRLLAMHHDILQQLLAGGQDARLYSPQAY